MKQKSGLLQRALIVGILMALISIVLVGTVVAVDNDKMDTCPQMMANNSMMSGSMMGGAGMMSAGSARMMESVEVNAMGGPMHEEMQGLVTKMMGGSISSLDQARMVEIMNKYPGASNMMMTRMMGGTGQGGYPGMMGDSGMERSGYHGMMGNSGPYSGYGMMGGSGPGGAGMMNPGFMWLCVILGGLFYTVWLAVGILAILWLVPQLRNGKNPS